MELNAQYWEERYAAQQTGWDAGGITTPIKSYIDQLTDRSLRILVPGAGLGYEAEYMFNRGFSNVFVADLAEQPLKSLKERCLTLPAEQLLHQDFFYLSGFTFDLIIEQTFFCALDPKLRPAYVKKMHELLTPGGKLVGVLFNVPLNSDRPPFGGKREDYLPLFQPVFNLKYFDPCYNSIPPRAGRELFISCEKP